MKKIIIFLAIVCVLGKAVNAQWQRFYFPNLGLVNTNSKYLYSLQLFTGNYLRTINDWQTWDTVNTGFSIYRFAADSTGQVLIAKKTGNYTCDLYLSRYQNPLSYLTSLSQLAYYNLYIHKNYMYVLNELTKIYRSVNYGNSFDTIEVFSNTSGTSILSISAVSDTILYAYCEMHSMPDQFNYASFDAGNTWDYFSFNAGSGNCFYVSPYVFVGYSNVYKSVDGGHNFSLCSPNYGGISSFAYKNGVLLIGTGNHGIYTSTNYGDTWTAFNDGLDSLCCNAYVAVTDSFYYVTMNDSITYRRSIHDLTGINSLAQELPLQLYPNPAANYFTIKSGNPQPLTYQLYNMQGSLQKEGRTTNSQTEINVAGLPRGMYILKVVTEKQTVTKKVLLQ